MFKVQLYHIKIGSYKQNMILKIGQMMLYFKILVILKMKKIEKSIISLKNMKFVKLG